MLPRKECLESAVTVRVIRFWGYVQIETTNA